MKALALNPDDRYPRRRRASPAPSTTGSAASLRRRPSVGSSRRSRPSGSSRRSACSRSGRQDRGGRRPVGECPEVLDPAPEPGRRRSRSAAPEARAEPRPTRRPPPSSKAAPAGALGRSADGRGRPAPEPRRPGRTASVAKPAERPARPRPAESTDAIAKAPLCRLQASPVRADPRRRMLRLPDPKDPSAGRPVDTRRSRRRGRPAHRRVLPRCLEVGRSRVPHRRATSAPPSPAETPELAERVLLLCRPRRLAERLAH